MGRKPRSGPPMPPSQKARPPPGPRPSAKPSASPNVKDLAPESTRVGATAKAVQPKAVQLRPSRAVPSSAHVPSEIARAAASGSRPTPTSGLSPSATSATSPAIGSAPKPSSRPSQSGDTPSASKSEQKPPRPQFGAATSSSASTSRPPLQNPATSSESKSRPQFGAPSRTSESAESKSRPQFGAPSTTSESAPWKSRFTASRSQSNAHEPKGGSANAPLKAKSDEGGLGSAVPSTPPKRQPEESTSRGAPPAAQAGPETGIASHAALRVQLIGKDEVGVGGSLIGDYREAGMNHGKKCYKKVETEAGKMNVFIYYWDARDGADFSGWWFGESVGGALVWARFEGDSLSPPKFGWKIPWNSTGTEKKDRIMVQFRAPPASSSAQPKGASAPRSETVKAHPPWVEMVNAAAAKTLPIEKDARQALRLKFSKEDPSLEEIKAADDKIQDERVKVLAATKTLDEDIKRATAEGAGPPAISMLKVAQKRLRKLQTDMTQEIVRLTNIKKQAEEKKNQREAELQAKAEEREETELQEALSRTLPALKEAEDAVETVVTIGSSITIDAEDEISDDMRQLFDEIEDSVKLAQDRISEGRHKISAELNKAQGLKTKVKTKAEEEFSALQTRINDADAKLDPFRRFKLDIEERQAAKKLLTEVTVKLSMVELDVEKVQLQSDVGPDGRISQADMKTMQELLAPTEQRLNSISEFYEQKLSPFAGGNAVKHELDAFLDRQKRCREMLKRVLEVLEVQRERAAAEAVLKKVHEKVEVAEEELVKSCEAEMPFLKGIEDVPQDEAATAIRECEAAAEKVQHAVASAMNFLYSKRSELKKSSKDLGQRILDEFGELEGRIQKVEGKLKQFQQDTDERKAKNLLQQITEQVSEAERDIEALMTLALSTSPEDLDQVSLEELRALCERTTAAQIQASAKLGLVSATLKLKLKACDSGAMLQELRKLEARLQSTHKLHARSRSAASDGQTCIQHKRLLQSVDEPLRSKSEDLAKMRAFVQNNWQEKPPSEQEIAQVVGIAQEVQSALDVPMKIINQDLASATEGALKRAREKRRDRLREVSEDLRSFRQSAVMQRQRLACEALLLEAEKRTEAVDSAMVQVTKAELPFFKGIEILPVEEAEASFLESDKAQDFAKQAIIDARSFVSAKCTEIGKMAETSMERVDARSGELASASKKFQELAAKLDEASETLRKLCTDTEVRKRSTLIQKVNDCLGCLENEVQKLPGMLEALSNAESVNMEKADQVCQHLAHFEKKVEGHMDEVQEVLTKARGHLQGYAELEPELHKFDRRHRSAQLEFAKAKIALRDQEKLFVASKLRLDALSMLHDLEADVAEVKKLAEPLLGDGGTAFILAQHVRSIGTALKEHVRDKGRTREAIFDELVSEREDKKIAKEVFLSYLEALPDKFDSKGLTFSEAQRQAIFAHLDADKDGLLSSIEFQHLFLDRYMCINGISVTDQFDVKEGKTLTKLEVNDVVESGSEAAVNDFGLMRIECTIVKSGTKGWVTMKGNQGTPYLEPFLPYASCVKSVEKLMESTTKRFSKIGKQVKCKTAQLMHYSEDPLLSARADLSKVKTQVAELQDTLWQKKGDLAKAKKDYAHRLEEESRLQRRACTQKAADSILDLLRASGCALQESLQKLRDAAKPLMSSSGINPAALDAPVSTVEAAEAAYAIVMREIDTASALLNEHRGVVVEAPDSPMYAVKVEIAKVTLSVKNAVAERRDIMGELRRTCTSMATRLLKEAAKALRKDMLQRGIKIDSLFSELVGQDSYISEDRFCKHLKMLNESSALEHWRLLFREIEVGGISRRRFCLAFQQYNLCVRGIAITTEFEIGKGSDGKTLRLLDDGELVEVLEGPISDKHLGIPRIKAAALRDGLQGWISVKGNQGTAFLQEAEKPYYSCTAAMSLDRSFRGGDAEEPIRKVMPDEVFEVLEGPRSEKPSDVFRARGKAMGDNAAGWFTVRTHDGEIYAEQSDKYWICTLPIAMTDGRDIKSSAAIRKLESGEVCFLLEGPIVEQTTRIRCRSLKDKQIGWITVRGNAGTTFAEQSTKHYRILLQVPLQAAFDSRNAERIRDLTKDEVVEVTEGPHAEKFDELVRLKGRFLNDGAEGWVTKRDGNLKAWSPWYSCDHAPWDQAPEIHSEMNAGKVLRRVNVGEKFEVFKGPQLDEQGALQARVRAEEDGIEGWIIIRDQHGHVFFTVGKGQH